MQAPQLPPMRPMNPASPPPAAATAPAATSKSDIGVSRRLRQLISYIAGGSFVLILLICLGQLVLRPGLTPADLMATIEAQTELGIMNQKLGHDPGEHVLTEDDYQRTLAQAQREGAAKAELAFQRELAGVQADKERVVGAYQTLYQRTGIITQAGVQMEQQALQFRQQFLAMTNGGRAAVLAVKDGLCALGEEDMCEKARALRKGMVDESTERDLAKKVNELMAGILDPATLAVREDERRYGTPAIQH